LTRSESWKNKAMRVRRIKDRIPRMMKVGEEGLRKGIGV
jgi:hypothetical protein